MKSPPTGRKSFIGDSLAQVVVQCGGAQHEGKDALDEGVEQADKGDDGGGGGMGGINAARRVPVQMGAASRLSLPLSLSSRPRA